MRVAYITSGFLSLALAIAGIILPLLPTTPFLLLSAFCFARSSEKFHSWLLNHPYFGKTIQDWQKHGSINRKAKISAMIFITLTILLSVALGAPNTILIIQIIVLSMSSLFILTRPDGPSKNEMGK